MSVFCVRVFVLFCVVSHLEETLLISARNDSPFFVCERCRRATNCITDVLVLSEAEQTLAIATFSDAKA